MAGVQRCTREGVTYEVKRLCGREAVVPSAASDALEAFAHQLYEARFGPGPGADLTAECDAVLKRAEETAARLARGEVRPPGSIRARARMGS